MKAARSPDGANLDRLKLIKGWLNAKGVRHEKIYDLAWAGQADKSRKPGKDGKLLWVSGA